LQAHPPVTETLQRFQNLAIENTVPVLLYLRCLLGHATRSGATLIAVVSRTAAVEH
jgi:hypothetical protein